MNGEQIAIKLSEIKASVHLEIHESNYTVRLHKHLRKNENYIDIGGLKYMSMMNFCLQFNVKVSWKS